MQLAGVSVGDICACFLPEAADETAVSAAVASWPRSSGVLKELQHLMGGLPWQEMRPEDRLRLALDKHYAEMAYFLWTHNYADLSGGDKQKADTCRAALEQRLAGTSGKLNSIESFYEEMKQLYKMGTPKLQVGNA